MYLFKTDRVKTDVVNAALDSAALDSADLDTADLFNTGAATAQSTTHLRLTRRGRIVFTTMAAVPLIIGALAFALNGGMAAATGQGASAGNDAVTVDATAFEYVTIYSGQSLWQVAETLAPTADPRDVIAEIVSLNQLSSEAVQPGQRLALPTKYSSADGRG